RLAAMAGSGLAVAAMSAFGSAAALLLALGNKARLVGLGVMSPAARHVEPTHRIGSATATSEQQQGSAGQEEQFALLLFLGRGGLSVVQVFHICLHASQATRSSDGLSGPLAARALAGAEGFCGCCASFWRWPDCGLAPAWPESTL